MKVTTKNSKLVKSFPGKRVGSISRTPIKSCPAAPRGGCVFSGKRCYSLRIGAMYPSVRKHWQAMDVLGEQVWSQVGDAIKREKIQVFRPFSSGGDFLSQSDLESFYAMARQYPRVKFYSYTKSLHLDLWSSRPANVTIVQSSGGIYDNLINPKHPIATVDGDGVDGSNDDSVAARGTKRIRLESH